VAVARTSIASRRAWPYARLWVLVRDTVFALFLVLFIHDYLFRVFLPVVLPYFAGRSMPNLPNPSSLLLLLIVLGAGRMLMDTDWRKRLLIPGSRWLAIFGIVLGAALITNVLVRGGIVTALPFIYLYFFAGAGISAGFSRRVFDNTIITIAIVNGIVTLVIGLFFLEEYRSAMMLATEVFKGQGILLYISKEITRPLLVPTGLIISYFNFGLFHILAGYVCLNRALTLSAPRGLKALCGILAGISLIITFFLLDRGNLLTMLAMYTFLFSIWYKRTRAASQASLRERTKLRITLAAMILALGISGVFFANMLKSQYQIDILDITNLAGKSEHSRIVLWERVLEDIHSQRGWLTGISVEYQMHNKAIPNSAPAWAWSERAYFTIDNGYINTLASGGLLALFAVVGLIIFAARRLLKERRYFEAGFLIVAALVYWMLEWNMALIYWSFILAGNAMAIDAAKPDSEIGSAPATQT